MSEADRWFALVEDDLRVAELCLEDGVFHMACFHSQQAAEKSLKGYRVAVGQDYPRTHGLRELLRLCMEAAPEFEDLEQACRFLDRFYAPTRYPDAAGGSLPGGLPGKTDAEVALAQAREVAAFVAKRLKPQRSAARPSPKKHRD